MHWDPSFGWKETLTAATLLLSVLTAIVSFGTAYLTLIRGAQLNVQIGDTLLLYQGYSQRLSVMPEIALYNAGVAVAAVTKISATVVSVRDKRDAKLVWTQCVTTEYKLLEQGGSRLEERFTRFDGYPSVLFVSKAEAISKRLCLVSMNPYPLAADDYWLEVALRVEEPSRFLFPARHRQVSIRRRISIGQGDQSFLLHFTPKSEGQKTSNLVLRYDPDPKRPCFIGTLGPVWTPPSEPSNKTASV